jgi:hypothetical protein
LAVRHPRRRSRCFYLGFAFRCYSGAYSPDPSGQVPKPIELAFGKLKRLFRAAAARTADALEAAIGAAIGHFTAAECSNHLRHCGYAQSGR